MQTIITKCDICKDAADRMPSWFSIERQLQGTKGVGNGLVQQVFGTPQVDYTGWARYEKWVDLCDNHKHKIMRAIQKICNEDKAE